MNLTSVCYLMLRKEIACSQPHSSGHVSRFPPLQMLINVLGPCFSIIFSRFLLDLGTSSTTVGLIFNSFQFLWNFSGPILGPLLKEFSWRKVAMTCSLGVFASLMLSAFATSSGFLLFSYSVLGGQFIWSFCCFLKDRVVYFFFNSFLTYIWLMINDDPF